MKIQKTIGSLAMMMSVMLVGTLMAFAQPGHGGPGGSRDPLAGLKRAITAASAPTLTATQETALTALIVAYRDAQPDEADAALETARDAYQAAVLAGNLTAVNTTAGQIAMRQAELTVARLKLSAKFIIDVLANLRAGGQLTLLAEKLGADKLFGLVSSLAGGGHGPRD